ncbi:MAG: tyrosine--tRNA ligase [Christensenellaceae bacterium]|nr:tyrosine--tRNA ligase [Christensenellaceae bacterium]
MNKLLSGIKRVAVQITEEKSLEERLNSGKQLVIKLGADPSRPDLHLGHAVVLRQIKKFQDAGHKVVFIVGDFTAMVGDPSGRSKTRPALTLEQTRASGATYFKQVTKILDPKKTEIVYNSKWLERMGFKDILELCAKYTVARILERDDFSKRFNSNAPIGVHELMYPLMQGFDSVQIKADIEVGGTDQTFNLLVGRDLQKDYGQIPQEVITFPLLVGLDGKEKMSKSLDNYIGIDEPPAVMFEKCMKVPDSVLLDYFRLTTDILLEEARELCKNMREAHFEYAKTIVEMYHSKKDATQAKERYITVASNNIPDDIKEVVLDSSGGHPFVSFVGKNTEGQATDESVIYLINALVEGGLEDSTSNARRMIEGGGIKVNGEVVKDKALRLSKGEYVIQKGKNKFVKVIIK